MNDDNFYKYIYENGNSYEIIKDNESYGNYRKLTDALYERDRLIKSDWNWDDALQLEETENYYEKMKLPKFIHPKTYIHVVYDLYLVYVDEDMKGRFRTMSDAFEFAKEVDGIVYKTNPRYRIQKTINGKQKSFGNYKTLEEAQKHRDKLIKRGWK